MLRRARACMAQPIARGALTHRRTLEVDGRMRREVVAEQLLQRPIDTVRLWIGEQKLTDDSATLHSCGLREGVEVLSSVTSDVRPQSEPQPEPEEDTVEPTHPRGRSSEPQPEPEEGTPKQHISESVTPTSRRTK